MKLLEQTLFRQQAYINGKWLDAKDGQTFPVSNPANEALLGTVPNMGAAETKDAIIAAENALPAWRNHTAKQRGQILRRWFQLMHEHQQDLALLMTLEQGKTLLESRAEIAYAASFLEWFSEEGKRIYGDTIPSNSPDNRILVTHMPIGVCAAITPWNFPSAMITRKVAPALAAGCTMVVKPAEATPYSALALAELAERAGVPAGVLNVVTGDPIKIGGELTANPSVRKLSFTGSTAVGKLLIQQCAATVKKVSMELGGNAPFIVFEDADIDAAVSGAMASKYRNSGQTCVCANRIYVQDGVYDIFTKKLEAEIRKLKVGSGVDEGVNIGPLINMAAVEKVEAHIADALEKGATVRLGGTRHALGQTFFKPTLLTDVTSEMTIAREETFGPLAPLFRFSTEEEVLKMANATEYGLAAYFYTRDLGRAWRVSEGLEFGMVGVNASVISTETSPFGGVKESGVGREGSKYGIDEYLEIKYTCIAGINA